MPIEMGPPQEMLESQNERLSKIHEKMVDFLTDDPEEQKEIAKLLSEPDDENLRELFERYEGVITEITFPLDLKTNEEEDEEFIDPTDLTQRIEHYEEAREGQDQLDSTNKLNLEVFEARTEILVRRVMHEMEEDNSDEAFLHMIKATIAKGIATEMATMGVPVPRELEMMVQDKSEIHDIMEEYAKIERERASTPKYIKKDRVYHMINRKERPDSPSKLLEEFVNEIILDPGNFYNYIKDLITPSLNAYKVLNPQKK